MIPGFWPFTFQKTYVHFLKDIWYVRPFCLDILTYIEISSNICLHMFTYVYICLHISLSRLGRLIPTIRPVTNSQPTTALRYSTVILSTHDLVRRWAAGHHRPIRRGQVLWAGDQLRAFFLQLACQMLETGYLILWLWRSLGVYGLCYTDCVAANNAADSFWMMQTIAHRRCSDITSNLSLIVAFAGPMQATWTWLGVSDVTVTVGGGHRSSCLCHQATANLKPVTVTISKNIIYFYFLCQHILSRVLAYENTYFLGGRPPVTAADGGGDGRQITSPQLSFRRLQHIFYIFVQADGGWYTSLVPCLWCVISLK